MKFRLAKASDCKQLARVFLACSAEDDAERENFAYRLGRVYVQQYYRVLTWEYRSVVLCGVDDCDPRRVLGFVSGTLDAAESMASFRRYRWRLGLAASLALLTRPGLLAGLVRRYRATAAATQTPPATATAANTAPETADGGSRYVIDSGARMTYWGVLPEARRGPGALLLVQKWLHLMWLLGAEEIRLELNRENTRAQQAHRMLGAEVTEQFVTPEGRERVIMRYVRPAASQASHAPTGGTRSGGRPC